MDATVFLEQIAKEAHYNLKDKELVQLKKIQEALKANNSENVKNAFSDKTIYLANSTIAVEI